MRLLVNVLSCLCYSHSLTINWRDNKCQSYSSFRDFFLLYFCVERTVFFFLRQGSVNDVLMISVRDNLSELEGIEWITLIFFIRRLENCVYFMWQSLGKHSNKMYEGPQDILLTTLLYFIIPQLYSVYLLPWYPEDFYTSLSTL